MEGTPFVTRRLAIRDGVLRGRNSSGKSGAVDGARSPAGNGRRARGGNHADFLPGRTSLSNGRTGRPFGDAAETATAAAAKFGSGRSDIRFFEDFPTLIDTSIEGGII